MEITLHRFLNVLRTLHNAIHYLLSDASNFVTGTILPVDGGFGAFTGV